MGMNSAMNACVALIEGRTDIAKEIIRAPGSDIRNVPEILARLDQAVNKTAAKALRNALVRTLPIQPDMKAIRSGKTEITPEECFFLGVTAVERVLEQVIFELEN